MCVNDLVVQGAEPLFFLDYYATGKLKIEVAKEVIKGIAKGCKLAGCSLIGGETAEMPDMYNDADYDLAGFSVGAVERENVLNGNEAAAGDILLGLGSSGLHSNGFSLIRKLIKELEINYNDNCRFNPRISWGDALLTPTKIYVRSCLEALKLGGITGLAHITGGGLIENPPRTFGSQLSAQIDVRSWEMPPVYRWLIKTGRVESMELARTFNCGIGMIVIVKPDQAETITKELQDNGESVFQIGHLKASAPGAQPVILENMDNW
jgi:phosphoribosylformylglycinamidine cyclo-ligase